MNLNLHLLRIFIQVAKLQSFSHAAKTLMISQPAVSKSVQELESQLDTVLIDRTGRGVALTEAGRLLHEYGQEIFAAERAAETALEQLADLQRGQLSIGASNTVGTYLLPSILGRFHRRYPAIKLSLEIGNTQQIVRQLHRLPLDLAFVEGPVRGDSVQVVDWRQDEVVIIAASDHPLAQGKSLTLAKVFDEPFIMREIGSGTREVFETYLEQTKYSIKIAMELGTNQAIKEAVIAGLGLGVVSIVTIKLELAAGVLTVLNVPNFPLQRMITQVTATGRPLSRAALVFQDFLAG
jgi:DNA-binding transcriptional LysR family regulator